jgi:signal transduction histidine kinase
VDQKIDRQGELRAEFRSEMHSLRADVASDLMTMEKRLNDQIVGLRRSVMEYHSSALGHGVLLSEFEERLRRVEQRLEIVPPESH